MRPLTDICDELKGRYPKDFKFTGWHPHCRCRAITILKTDEELARDFDRILAGHQPLPSHQSSRAVTAPPPAFTQWLEKNATRIQAAQQRGTLPYFLRDNMVLWEERSSSGGIKYKAAMKLGRAATKAAKKVVQHIGAPNLTEEQELNIRNLADALGIPRNEINPMNYLDADHGVSNPTGDRDNCQSVVVAFAARRRGLDCVALPFNDKNAAQVELMEKFQNAFLTKDKNGNWQPVKPTVIKGKTDEEIIRKAKKQITQDGEYVLGINFKKIHPSKEALGHVANLICRDGRIYINDEQISDYIELTSYSDLDSLEILKIDNLILDVSRVSKILKVR